MKRLILVLPFLALFAPASQAATPAGWQTYHDVRGFSVSFPRDWKADPDYYDDDYPTGGDPPPRLRALAIVPSGDLGPGTTLNSAGVRIAVLPLPPFRKECAAWSFIAEPPPDYNSSFDSDTPDYAHLVGGDPAGWYTYEDFVWRISTAPCVGVHYTIAYYADGSAQAKSAKPFDRAKLLKLLDAIRATVVLDPPRKAD
ncbi:MAG: hypothetical protein HY243_01310 [Proteobacteria bacterium]|nr:hypothetical protein [Pseudomonadota bacterium]